MIIFLWKILQYIHISAVWQKNGFDWLVFLIFSNFVICPQNKNLYASDSVASACGASVVLNEERTWYYYGVTKHAQPTFKNNKRNAFMQGLAKKMYKNKTIDANLNTNKIYDFMFSK